MILSPGHTFVIIWKAHALIISKTEKINHSFATTNQQGHENSSIDWLCAGRKKEEHGDGGQSNQLRNQPKIGQLEDLDGVIRPLIVHYRATGVWPNHTLEWCSTGRTLIEAEQLEPGPTENAAKLKWDYNAISLDAKQSANVARIRLRRRVASDTVAFVRIFHGVIHHECWSKWNKTLRRGGSSSINI